MLRALLDILEPELTALGFRLDSEVYHHAAFGSADLEYYRRGTRVRLTWDGKDRWAWMNLAAQPTSAVPSPNTYRHLDAGHVDPSSLSPRLATTEHTTIRAHELIERLRVALASTPSRTQE